LPPETAIGRSRREDAAAARPYPGWVRRNRNFEMASTTGIPRFQRLFRSAAGLDVDKTDLRRFEEFVNRKIHDLLLRGVANAKANGRDVIEPWDLPITKGLQECMHGFRALDEEIELQPLLDEMARRPPLELDYTDELEARLPDIAGGLGVALARSFKIIHPDLKNPQAQHWDQAFGLFDLLL
jgi:hypothetical protein